MPPFLLCLSYTVCGFHRYLVSRNRVYSKLKTPFLNLSLYEIVYKILKCHWIPTDLEETSAIYKWNNITKKCNISLLVWFRLFNMVDLFLLYSQCLKQTASRSSHSTSSLAQQRLLDAGTAGISMAAVGAHAKSASSLMSATAATHHTTTTQDDVYAAKVAFLHGSAGITYIHLALLLQNKHVWCTL